MKELIKDPLNIKNEEMHVTPTRVKMFILNSQNEYILISAFDGLQLPGGHVEGDEDITTAVIREVMEETGISLTEKEITEPFFKVARYSKTENNLNKCSTIIYYHIKTNKNYNLQNRNLTEHEIQNNYSIKSVPANNIEEALNNVIKNSSNEGSKVVAQETLFAYSQLNF